MITISYVVLAGLTLISIYTDVKGFKIKNLLTLPSALLALVLSIIQFSVLFAFINFFSLLIIGILGEVLKLWKTGDTKLILSTGMWLSLTSPVENISLSFFYFLTFILLHLLIGHFYALKKSRFSLQRYTYSLFYNKENESYGRFRGAITISISLLIVISVQLL